MEVTRLSCPGEAVAISKNNHDRVSRRVTRHGSSQLRRDLFVGERGKRCKHTVAVKLVFN